MRTRVLLFAGAVIAGAVVAAGELRETPLPATVRTPAEFAAFMDSALPRWMERYRVPGVCTGVVVGEVERLRCDGEARAGAGRPVTPASRFGVASVSKTFTALAVLTLAGRGDVSLDDRVERHLRAWRFPEGPHDGSAVTIRQLLTHTAGAGVSSYGGAGSPGASETTRDVLEGRGGGRPPVTLLAAPGSGFRYSGGGYMVLQLLVEDVSGMPFDRFVANNVFRPLGMRDSSFSWGAARDVDTVGHDVAGRPVRPHRYGAAMAPGAMVTTAEDMLRFTSAFAHSRLGALLGWPGGTWEQYVARGQGHYGMGLTATDANGHVLVGHAGTTMGYNAGFSVSPAEGFGWFVLENGNGGVFLNADLNRLLLAWKTGSADPRHRVMKMLRAAVAFLAVVLPALGALLLAAFAASASSGRRRWLGTSDRGRAAKAMRVVAAALLGGFVVLWVVLFHTEAFYPAVTTAWMPVAFRFVSAGVALLALRAALSCVFVRERPLTAALAG